MFPDHVFRPREPLRPRYDAEVRAGRARTGELAVTFCGIARNLGPTVHTTIANVEAMGALFARYQVVLYENDSDDGTDAELAAWAARDARVHVTSVRLQRPRHPHIFTRERMRDMAYYRSTCRELTLELEPTPFYILLDADFDGGFSLEGLAQTFAPEIAAEWDVAAANGLFIVREQSPLQVAMLPAWKRSQLPVDRWVGSVYDAAAIVDEHGKHGWRRGRAPDRGEPLMPVRSAFGGLAVYSREAWLAGSYDDVQGVADAAEFEGGNVCEHVPFHLSMHARGFRVRLNPSLLAAHLAFPRGFLP